VLSYAYWHAQFNADPGVVGRTVQFDKHPFTVLGVAPRDFRGTELFFAPALWIPIVEQPLLYGDSLDKRDGRGDWLIGRLKPSVTQARAGARRRRSVPIPNASEETASLDLIFQHNGSFFR